ncbi:MAG: rhomboid family intramembrane serine protease [Candidatus Micrarchaeota archaeon]
MRPFRKFPIATALLTAVVLLSYWMLAAGTPYITDENLDQFALNPAQPLSLISHLFIHVGIFHLIGNLAPLIFFGLALEFALLSADVVLIFLISGMGASFLFAITNPGVPLIGASAGISGMLSAVLLVKPKAALVLLIATPLLISLVFFPAAEFGGKFFEQNLEEKKAVAEQKLTDAVRTNQTPQVIQQINQTLQKTEEQIVVTEEGKEREAETPTDFMVHVYGAIIGGFYVYTFKRQHLKAAEKEFISIGSFFYEKLDVLAKMFKKR